MNALADRPKALAEGRRRWVLAGLAMAAWAPARAATAVSAVPTGWARPPEPLPALELAAGPQPGRALADRLRGKVSAVQTMFTGCGTTCPTQGALFAAVAPHLRAPDAQLVSLSVDVLGDDAQTLARWQARFGPHPAWWAAVPRVADVDRLCDFLRGGPGRRGTHTAQVFVFDRQARLIYRTGDNPGAAELIALLAHVGAQA